MRWKGSEYHRSTANKDKECSRTNGEEKKYGGGEGEENYGCKNRRSKLNI